LSNNQLTTLIGAAFPILSLAIWGLAYKFAGKGAPSIGDDLRELATESLHFLKTQWFFLAVCTGGSAVSACQHSGSFEIPPTYVIVSSFFFAIVPILKLFYVSYLAIPRNPALVASIGVMTMVFYMIGEYIQNMLILLGFVLLIFPGLYVMARTSLFLPIYAVEGHRPLQALERSWAITNGKFWQVCLYLGPVVFVVLMAHWLPFAASFMQPNIAARPFVAVFSAVCGMSFILLDIMLAGLMYKLYLRFNEKV